MKIEHIAIWSKDIERLKSFYVQYLNGKAGSRYHNSKKQFQSYFITFESGARLELMQMSAIPDNLNHIEEQYIGIIHIAFSVGSKEKVDELTEVIRIAGYSIASEPRFTGDGYYESCILDPDGNRIEITL
ncbi:MAG TPA: VOC family protein [Patescibacteria group bacterium]|nr:VOC family protein [Patescibacteria group bacterium]